MLTEPLSSSFALMILAAAGDSWRGSLASNPAGSPRGYFLRSAARKGQAVHLAFENPNYCDDFRFYGMSHTIPSRSTPDKRGAFDGSMQHHLM